MIVYKSNFVYELCEIALTVNFLSNSSYMTIHCELSDEN